MVMLRPGVGLMVDFGCVIGASRIVATLFSFAGLDIMAHFKWSLGFYW